MGERNAKKFRRIGGAIVKASGRSGKTYSFDESHDKNMPSQMWFQESDEGLILFVVFYTQACRWSRCLACNLPSKCSQFHVDWEAIWAQVEWVFSQSVVVDKKEEIKKVIISNNGSILDEVTFSTTALVYLVANLNKHLPNLYILSIETRPEYADFAELEFLSRVLREGKTPTELELAVGFEAFDDRIRNDVFHKGLRLEVFEDFIKKVAPYKYRVKCYFMQKPVPGMTDEEAVQDIKNAIDYLSEIAKKYKVRINMHLNPTYAARGTALEKSFREERYTPPELIDVAKAALYAKGKNISIFLGLCDEGLAVEGGSFIRKGDEKLVKQLELFNKTQDYRILSLILRNNFR